MINENFIPDVITDQTSAHDILDGYVPNRILPMRQMILKKLILKNMKSLSELFMNIVRQS